VGLQCPAQLLEPRVKGVNERLGLMKLFGAPGVQIGHVDIFVRGLLDVVSRGSPVGQPAFEEHFHGAFSFASP